MVWCIVIKMSTRSRRVATAALLPRITRCICSKCGVVHEKPTETNCKLVNRDIFATDLADENADQSTNRTSTPQNEGNQVVSPITAPLPTGENIQTVAGTNEGGVPTISPPSNVMWISVKLDNLANAVSTINSRLMAMGTEVQDLKTKCKDNSRAWDDVMNLSVSVLHRSL